MKPLRTTNNFILCLIISLLSSFNLTAQSTLDWMEDQPPTNTVTRFETNKLSGITGFPRRSIGTVKAGMTSPKMACFDIVCQKPFNATTIAAAQAINPNLVWLREYSPVAWQGQTDANDKETNGHPFNTTGPATANNEMFAGHWGYKPYTTLTADITEASGIVVSVANPGNAQSGTYYYVIRPADSWDGAEHVKITKTGTTLTIGERGYKSLAKPWPAGSIIAQHQLGNGTGNLNWLYNYSTKCPVDGNGKRLHEAFAAWLASHYDKDGNGLPHAVAVCDGILFDSDVHYFVDGGNSGNRNADFDCDGQADWGFDPDGTNHWGNGLEKYYADVRAGIDARGKTNVIILGGVAETWGVPSNNGTQLEAAWSNQFGEDGVVVNENNYNRIGYFMSGLKAQTGHGVIGPRITDVQGKEASVIYHGTAIPATNSAVRFSYSMTMMFDGAWFSNQNGFGDSFHYFDEDAVYMSAGENFGKSVPKANTADIILNNRWLGNALGQYKRIYDPTTFGLSNNLIPNGDFESAPSSWTGSQASVATVTDKHWEGSSCLEITPNNPNNSLQITGATVTGPTLSLAYNQEYSLCFAIYSEEPSRFVIVRMGSMSQKVFVTPGWSKHVYSWRQSSNQSSSLQINVGAQLTKVWIDQVYLFAASADVFRRDFENGIILSNASNTPKTISLGGTYRRILGTLDAGYNNGQTDITQITLAPHDGIFLIKHTPTVISKNIDKQFSAYPNPFSSNFIIDFPEGFSKFEIFDICGVKIWEMGLDNIKTLKVDQLTDKPSGLYFTKLSGSSGTYFSKVVKN